MTTVIVEMVERVQVANSVYAPLDSKVYFATNEVNIEFTELKDAVQSVCKQRLCLHFGIQNIEFYSTTIYIFTVLEYNK